MKKSDFYYELPEELIAQTPIEPRDSSRLMLINRENKTCGETVFRNIIDYLNDGDLLVLNDTRVLPARIYGTRDDTGAVVEFVLLKQREICVWECIAGPGKKAKVGHNFTFSDNLSATVTEVLDDGNRVLDFSCKIDFFAALDEVGISIFD